MTARLRLRILVVAEESAGVRLVKELGSTDHDVVAVVAARRPSGGTSGLREAAESMELPVVDPERLLEPEGGDFVRSLECDLLVNVHSLFVLPGPVVTAPEIGAYNLHPGPLPEMAGLNAPSWTIFEERPRHGVSVHEMEEDIDTGAVVHEERFDVAPRETGLSLMTRCVTVGVPLVLRLIDGAAAGRRPEGRVQDRSQRVYHGREVPNDGWIDWGWPASRIDAFVRACDYGPFVSPWGRPRALVDGEEVEVLAAEAVGEPSDAEPGVVVAVEPGGATVAAENGALRIGRVRRGGSNVPPHEVFRSGQTLGPWI